MQPHSHPKATSRHGPFRAGPDRHHTRSRRSARDCGTNRDRVLAPSRGRRLGGTVRRRVTENDLSLEQGSPVVKSLRDVERRAALDHHRSRPERHDDPAPDRVLKGKPKERAARGPINNPRCA